MASRIPADMMSQGKSRLYVQVPVFDDSSLSPAAVYRAVCKLVPENLVKDGWLSVYQYQHPEQEPGEGSRFLVIEFANPQISKNIDVTKPLNINGTKLELLKSPNTGDKQADSSTFDLNDGQLSDQMVSYRTTSIRDEKDLTALKMLLSPASGIKLQYQPDNSRLLVTFPHSDLLIVEAQLRRALQYLNKLRADSSKSQPKVIPCLKCPICFQYIDETDSLRPLCGHVIHSKCYTGSVINKFFKCPQCQIVAATPNGNQPDGTMSVRQLFKKLSGHEKDSTGTYEITYTFPDGIQTDRHPKPGARYSGTNRVAYLPMSKEGERVLRLLDRAFKARLTFTVGTSNTTGVSDTVVWNKIHHKTSNSGGPYGYPDADYLKRVTKDLAAAGITDDS